MLLPYHPNGFFLLWSLLHVVDRSEFLLTNRIVVNERKIVCQYVLTVLLTTFRRWDEPRGGAEEQRVLISFRTQIDFCPSRFLDWVRMNWRKFHLHDQITFRITLNLSFNHLPPGGPYSLPPRRVTAPLIPLPSTVAWHSVYNGKTNQPSRW